MFSRGTVHMPSPWPCTARTPLTRAFQSKDPQTLVYTGPRHLEQDSKLLNISDSPRCLLVCATARNSVGHLRRAQEVEAC